MELGLKGKSALVTGGSYGIGRAIALALAAEGSRVAICARTKDRLEATAADIRSRGCEALYIPADVNSEHDIQNVVQTVVQTWGPFHILVNNVGEGVAAPVPPLNRRAMTFGRACTPPMLSPRCGSPCWLSLTCANRVWGRVVTIASLQGREKAEGVRGITWPRVPRSA